MNAVVGTRGFVEDRAGIRGQRTEVLLHHRTEGLKAHLIEIHPEATFGALVAFSVISPRTNDRVGDFADFFWLHPGIEGQGVGIHLG